MKEIRLGLKDDLDVSRYADRKFDCKQMHEIRLGLKDRIDISQCIDPEFDWKKMKEIRRRLSECREELLNKIELIAIMF